MTLANFLLVLFVSAIQIGLAILGMGGLAPFFAHPALQALAVGELALLIVSMFSEGSLSQGEREDRNNRWVLLAFGAVMLLHAYLPAYTDRIGFWTIDGETTRWLGTILFTAGGALRIGPVFVLGRRFSGLVAIQRDHELVTSGIYSVIRNPSYLGMLINMLGWGLAFRSGVGVLLTGLMVLPLVGRILAEEAMLRAQFGAEFDAYCARTSRLIPGVY